MGMALRRRLRARGLTLRLLSLAEAGTRVLVSPLASRLCLMVGCLMASGKGLELRASTDSPVLALLEAGVPFVRKYN